jgi:hypothetical protein
VGRGRCCRRSPRHQPDGIAGLSPETPRSCVFNFGIVNRLEHVQVAK